MIVYITRFRFANKNNNKGKNCHNLYKTKGSHEKKLRNFGHCPYKERGQWF